MGSKSSIHLSQWHEMRDESSTFLEEAATTLAPLAGLSANAVAHLREDWIEWRDDYVRITVPAEDSCNDLKLTSGPGGMNQQITYRSKSCGHCRDQGKTNGFEHRQTGSDGAVQYETRLHREAAAPAIQFLEYVFQDLGRVEVGASPKSISGAVFKLVNEDSAESAYSKLRRTGPVIYAHYGLSPEDIATLTPFSKRSIKDIIAATPEIRLTGVSTQALLKIIHEREPVTASTLAEETGLTYIAIQKRLKRLKQRERVAVENGHDGPPAGTWRTTTAWNQSFACESCEFTSHCLGGVRTHEGMIH